LKRLNLSAWITLFLTYILPYRYTDGFETSFGYPIPFVSVYDIPIDKTPFMSMSVNALAIIFDVLIVYLVIWIVMKLWNRFHKDRLPKQ
jgi:hypothetical protein